MNVGCFEMFDMEEHQVGLSKGRLYNGGRSGTDGKAIVVVSVNRKEA
jgi:hypothetical protein